MYEKFVVVFKGGVTLFNFRAKPAYADGVPEIVGKGFKLFEIGRDILKKLNETPFEELKNKADDGDKEAQYFVGLYYYFGAKDDGDKIEKLLFQIALSSSGSHITGIIKNLEKAFTYFQNSAEQSYPPAQFALANMYCNGEGTSQNPGQALKWYKEAARNGIFEAEYNIGVIYRYGMGNIPESKSDAFDHFFEAAKHDIPEAQYEISKMYKHGEGVNQDEKEALKWLREAAKEYAPAQYKLANRMRHEEQYKEANKLYLKAANPSQAYPKGYAPAQVSLGIYYSRSKEQEKKAKAMDWFNKAAEQGNAYAQWLLGDCYSEQGDEAKAKEFYEKAAQQGSAESQYRLSKSYYRTFKEEDVSSAWKWCLKAVEQGHVDAQRQLAEWYETCYGVSENYVRAYTYYYLSYLCGDETYKTAAKYDMERLRKEIEDSVWWSWFGLGEKPHKAKVSQSQAEEAKKEADKLYDAIQKRIKHAKHQNAVFRQLGEDEQQDLQKLIDETKTRNWKDKLIEDKKFFVKKGLQFLWTLVVLGILIWLWLSK